jgi:parallel beta-helix repeat protein
MPYTRLPFIYIRADGTVEPANLPIKQVGDVYSFTDDISNYTIWVQRDNIVIDGQGFTLHGNRTNGIVADGIYLNSRTNVTVRDLTIRFFEVGIWNSQNSGNNFGVNIINNRITECDQGVTFVSATNNSVIGNNITGNGNGINMLSKSYFNDIESNIIEDNSWGIYFQGYNNMIESNTIAGNSVGILLDSVNNTFVANDNTDNFQGVVMRSGIHTGNNLFYLNNFVNNGKQVAISSIHIGGVWDNGLVGNYWSDYVYSDLDANGIGDSPYVIHGTVNYEDSYPLMHSWLALDVNVLILENSTYIGTFPLDFTLNKPVIWMGYSLDGHDNITITGNTTLIELTDGLHNITVYARDELERTGASETIHFTMETPFPTLTVAIASAASVVGGGAAVVVYFKKYRRERLKASTA